MKNFGEGAVKTPPNQPFVRIDAAAIDFRLSTACPPAESLSAFGDQDLPTEHGVLT